MAFFKIVIRRSAETELHAVPFPFRRQLNQRIIGLKEEPRPSDAEPLSEAEKYRLTVHGWRILYEVDDDRGLVTVWAVRKN